LPFFPPLAHHSQYTAATRLWLGAQKQFLRYTMCLDWQVSTSSPLFVSFFQKLRGEIFPEATSDMTHANHMEERLELDATACWFRDFPLSGMPQGVAQHFQFVLLYFHLLPSLPVLL
jgi:hypothetical protein